MGVMDQSFRDPELHRTPLQIVIVDPRNLWRESLRLTIERLDPAIEIVEVETFAGIEQNISDKSAISLIILNVDLARPQELDQLIQLERLCPDVPVAVVADFPDPDQVVAVLARGARGCLPGTMESRVMVEALRLISAGGAYIPSIVLELLDSGPEGRLPSMPNGEPLAQVQQACTPRQCQVLKLLCQGMPNNLIAYELGISENTVKAHLRQIMKQLNVTNRTEAVLIASGLAEIAQPTM